MKGYGFMESRIWSESHCIDGGNEKAQVCMDMGADLFIDYMIEGKRLATAVKPKSDGGADFIFILSPIQGAYE